MAGERPTHSPLGASSAERWMNCPGSVALLALLTLPESDEPDYRREGTAMHEAAAHCLTEGLDTWEITGQTFNNTVIDDEMGRAIQVYLDAVRPTIDASSEHWVEYGLSGSPHPLMYGTLDFGAMVGSPLAELPDAHLPFVEVTDLKGGEGIIVEPEENPQLMYYAFLLIDEHPEWPDDMDARLRIAQPRGYHEAGTVREWWTTVGAIRAWVKETLVPAMLNVEVDNTLDPGPWCRFCPAKLVCPMLTSLFRAAMKANPKEVVNLSDESIGRSYQYKQAVRFYLNALEEETFRRLNLGHEVPGTKLVPKKSNRVYVSGAAAEAKKRFGKDAVTPEAMKSPAELEKVSPAAKAFVKEHAYLPQTGYTVALESDPKPGVKMKTTHETFGAALAALEAK